MTFIRRYPLLVLIILLLMTSIACQALTTLQAPAPSSNSEIDREAVVAAAVATVTARLPETNSNSGLVAPTPVTTNTQVPAINSDLQDKLIDVYARVNPSVVHIFVYEQLADTNNEDAPPPLPIGSGTGFVYSTDGYIVTNNHVVVEGRRFEVVFADETHRNAELVGTDVDSDLGVIKVTDLPPDIPSVSLSDSNDLQVGQFVIAIGNPFGESGSMSIGIVSGLGRTLLSQRLADDGGRFSLPEVIQTDAAINPGNSGGPLLNLDGEVVGVNSAIQTLTGTNSGVGFSIPVNAVKRIVPKLIEDGVYTYPYIGIRMANLTLDLQEEFGIGQTEGAYVTGVSSDSPAEAAGLIGSTAAGGDLIIAINGTPINTTDELIGYLVFETETGQTVDLTVIRDGTEIIIPLTLGERP